MSSAGAKRCRFAGDVDVLATQIAAIAVDKGRSFCKWPDESERVEDSTLHVKSVEAEHELLAVLKRAQGNMSFSRKQIETVVEKVILLAKWKLGAKDKEDMIRIMANRIKNMCRSVHQAELKASPRSPPAWIRALPWRRAEGDNNGDESDVDGSVDEEAAKQASERILNRCVLPPNDDPVKAEEMAVAGAHGRILRRCTRKVADGASFVYGWDPETLCAWRISSESKSNQKLLSEPLKVPDGAAPHDFMVGRWPDGSTHQINLTVEAFKLQTERRASGESRSILWSDEHDRTHHSLQVCQKTDRALLCFLAEQSRQICQTRMDLFGDVPDQWSLLPMDHPTLLAAKAFMVKLALRYKSDELDLKPLKTARDEELKTLGLYVKNKPLPKPRDDNKPLPKLAAVAKKRARADLDQIDMPVVAKASTDAGGASCARGSAIGDGAVCAVARPDLAKASTGAGHKQFVDAEFPAFGDDDLWPAMS